MDKKSNLGENCILDPEWACIAIKFSDFRELLNNLKYGSVIRVSLLMLAYTGCRVKELERMQTVLLNKEDCSITWYLGKNQKGSRRESLPEVFIEELEYYRSSTRCSSKYLFHLKACSLRRQFQEIRKEVGGVWSLQEEKGLSCDRSKKEYLLKVKGFRKSFQTILFKYFMDKYNDAGVALEMISKRMRHSSERMTAYHYIENYEAIDVEGWINNFFCKKPNLESQTSLTEFTFSSNIVE